MGAHGATLAFHRARLPLPRLAHTSDRRALLLYNSILAILLLGPLVMLLEHPSGWFDHPSVPSMRFWSGMIIAGVFGLLINFAYFAQLKCVAVLRGSAAVFTPCVVVCCGGAVQDRSTVATSALALCGGGCGSVNVSMLPGRTASPIRCG